MKANTQITDRELLEKIQDRDNGAFDVFYRRYCTFVARKIKRLMPDKELANDVIQDFWMRLWEKPAILKTNEEGSAFNFLYSFLFTFILPVRRMYNKYASRLVSLEELDVSPKHQQYTHVLEDVEVKELIRLIDSIVDSLPEPQHTIYILFRQNRSIPDIAETVRLSQGSVRNYLTRISKTMRAGVRRVIS